MEQHSVPLVPPPVAAPSAAQSSTTAAPPRVRDRRRAAALVVSALAVPLLWTAIDVVVRRSLLAFVRPVLRGTYFAGAALGLALWGLGMEAARHPRRGVRVFAMALLAFTAAFGIGGQTFFRTFTNGYVNRDMVMLAAGMPELIMSYVRDHAVVIGVSFLVPATFVTALAMARARRFGPLVGRWSFLYPVGAAAALFFIMFGPLRAHWEQCLPPDVLWLHASVGPALEAVGLETKPKAPPPGRRAPLPAAPVAPPDAPSIVVLFGESVRRDVVCAARAAGCSKSPAVDASAPDRIGYARSFSVDACTELSSMALWTGLPITARLDELATAPLLWDYAKAKGYRTAYLASQNLLFQNLGLFLRTSRIDALREARDRDREASITEGTPDEIATREALDFLEKGGGPALVFVHFSNTHLPYRQAEGYTPYPTQGLPEKDTTHNRYLNSIAHNDAVIGDFLAKLRQTPGGKRAVVISFADHGEAFDEHGAYSHTFDLFAEEINVPLWIDAPPGSLPDAAIERLRREAPTRPASTLDVSATVIDLVGGLDELAFREQTSRLGGDSLLRDRPADRTVILRNCSDARYCAPDAFGVVAFPLKLHYVGREFRYACHDLEVDPEEQRELPRERCAPLKALTDRMFGPHLDVLVETGRH